VIDFIKIDLITFSLSDNTLKSKVITKYDLHGSQCDKNKTESIKGSIRNLWSCDSNQSLFVVMTAIGSKEKLHLNENQININNNYKKRGLDQSKNQNAEFHPLSANILTLDLADDMFWNYKHISLP
jgi:hypothetical protein